MQTVALKPDLTKEVPYVRTVTKEAYDYLRGFVDGTKGESRPITALDVLYRYCRKYIDLLEGEARQD